MTYLVLGGGASGKSEYAEEIALNLAGGNPRYYVATMLAYGEAGAYRVKRHRALRQGKGFETLEIPTQLEKATQPKASRKELSESTALVEDLSNLLANEMFQSEIPDTSDDVAERILFGMKAMTEVYQNVIFVSNNIFEDGCQYDDVTKRYIELLGIIHEKAAVFVDKITEVIVGIPQELK